MPSYKLTYFDARGTAEFARLVFKQAGQEFEDVRIPMDQWPGIKEEQPMKALPVLEIDGRKFCQSAAIVRYLGKKFGLMGSDEEEGLVVDELMEVFAEMVNKHLVGFKTEQDESKKLELVKKFKEETFPLYSSFIEKRLDENKNKNGEDGYYVGKTVTVADLGIYYMMFKIREFMKRYDIDLLEGRTAISDHMARVEQLPNIAKWLKERPQTEF
ncbi:glutathione S-transferase 1-like isoform X1 [Mya arenaria]|uniref:glutathione S-transferase 1-like isoform X1 n=1 Tax=Mya arenaria TaxID=6604 RepID=UPI0022E7C8D7|nr:glutathione S-transferase 1-like isoform X1 [Mya arenaria]